MDLAQPAGIDVIDKAADQVTVLQERRSPDAQDGLAHVGIEVAERLDRKRRRHAGRLLQLGPKSIVCEGLHTAAGVVDEHHLARAQPPLGYRQRADHVISDHPAGVAQDVRLAVAKAQCREDVQTRVHARHDGQPPAWANVELAAGLGVRVGSIVGEELVDDAHPRHPNRSRNQVAVAPLGCLVCAPHRVVVGWRPMGAQRIAFLFPGQGSQRVGMGADLLAARPDLFDRYFEQADAASGLPVRALALEGPIEELTRTDVTQPALFALSLALNELARESGLEPDFVAGHSLGEDTAAVAAGALDVQAGMELVALRGRLMAHCGTEHPGGMAAIIGLPADDVRALCQTASEAGTVAPANLNSPRQVVCSGEEAGVQRLLELAEEAGASKAVRLKVAAAFHSVLMEPVQREMAAAMDKLTWKDPEIPLVANATGTVLRTGEEVCQALVAQIASPVLWVDCVQTLIGEGCTRFLELGPGRVLGGLVRQINSDMELFAADSPEKLEQFAQSTAA
jgi:[acyl-carrier-protein] S-malonyltransferase